MGNIELAVDRALGPTAPPMDQSLGGAVYFKSPGHCKKEKKRELL